MENEEDLDDDDMVLFTKNIQAILQQKIKWEKKRAFKRNPLVAS